MAVPIQKLEDQLNCSICLDTYTDPKLLQCFHVYCRKCLVKLMNQDQQGQLLLSCPICRQATSIPANGVAGLQSAFLITPLLEIVEKHKKAKPDPPVASAEGVEADSTSLAQPIEICCREHVGKEVELFCETCEEPICLECSVKSGKHFGHMTELLKKAFEKYKEEIAPSMEAMENQLTTINKALAQLDTRSGEISDQQAAIEYNICENINKLHQFLEARKIELISQLHQTTQWKLKSLAVQKDQIETTQAQLSSCLEFIRKSLRTDHSQREVLMMKTTIVKHVEELTNTFQPDLLRPNTEADMILLTSENFTKACQNYGQVVLRQDLVNPLECCATGRGVEAAVVGETSTALLQAINYKSQPCQVSIKSSECELVSEITGTRVRGKVERKGDSQYEIIYQPNIKGRHQLHIKVEDQHIRGSPFSITVTSLVWKLGTPILTIGKVVNPWGVSINQQGEVVVSERGKHCVSVFSPNGERLQSFGTHGSNQGQFDHPAGVAVDAEGNILVVDCWNHRIQKLTVAGQFLAAVGTDGNGCLQFHYPRGIAVNIENSKIYVCDSGNNRIQVLNSDLTFSNIIGKKGSGKGQFDFPWGIACDSTGSVYVADSDNYRIQVLAADGRFLRMFGGHGECRGKLMEPSGLAINTNGMVYVTHSCVSVFTSEGQHVTSFGSSGEGDVELDCPRGVAVDSNGVVYVCDCVNQRVVLF